MPRFFVKTNQINNDNIDKIGEDEWFQSAYEECKRIAEQCIEI